eukprot:CAMPEP_0195289262 /NCGR_PEP_ID=MMETSP0707-20130614/5611_1 /TAXON_ID=33640 /ORGANISM="Asterionellopsis glacialis, Strain CCMP134" /LENGTH=3115 /DNA_ID=CAMNT_0040349249 /DNA_START=115 /DNA_END=9462 /DNA_ORIENTATION=+
MEGDDGASGESNPTRWTCEACGCHTNTNETNSLSCGVCGTRRGPSLMRRAGGHSASARLFARSFAARREAIHAETGFDDDTVMDDHLDPDEMGDDDEEHAAAALALEVAGVTGAARAANAHNNLGRRLRSLAGGGPPSSISAVLSESAESRPPPDEILLAATENAMLYKPTWLDMSQLNTRSRHSNGIILGTGGHQNVAHLPLGVGEGRPVRTVEPFPRGTLPPRNTSPGTVAGLAQDRKRRRSFGFRVVFDHPRRDAGFDMGGCYFVGVTTQAFTTFGERNALQQSRFSWGIEDHGNKFEGRLQSHARVPGRGGSSNYGVEISRSEALRNSDNVLFGSREVITVVADLETRTLTYWRDGRLLGSLVSNLPRTGNIYPVVVPFNAGVSVAISAMDSSPLPLLQSFVTDWKRTQQEREDLHRRKLIMQRSVLIQSGKPTYELLNILKMIFGWYARKGSKLESGNMSLDPVAAFRLWYRCGMKLSTIQDLLEKKMAGGHNKGYSALSITLDDFLNLITQIVGEEELSLMAGSAMIGLRLPGTSLQVLRGDSTFEVGDVVELVESYERFGDAPSGPLHPGDRGKVVEIQQGQRGEQHSIRVIHNGRRWGYQPQALLSERSGLIDSPAVWFIRKLLRAHGFDHTNLQPIWGKPVTPTSWQIGDLVVPNKTQAGRRQNKRENNKESAIHDKSFCMGRIVAEPSSTSSSQQASRGRESGIVSVEFVDPNFGTSTGVVSVNSTRANVAIQTKKIRVNRLIHTTFFHGTYVADSRRSSDVDTDEDVKVAASSSQEGTERELTNSELSCDSEAGKQGIEIAGIARLESSAIDLVTKECEKSSASIAGMFAAGLPDAVISAIDHAVYEITDPESGRDVSPAISSLGKLTVLIAKHLFCNKVPESKNEDTAANLHESPSQDETESSRSPRSEQGRHPDQALQQAARRLHVQPDSPDNALSQHVQDLIRGLNNAGGLSSTQQGRSMLLALMSGARMNNVASPGSQMAENHLDLGLGFDNTNQVANNTNHLMFSQLHQGSGLPPYFAFNQAGAMPQTNNWSETNPFSGAPRTQGRFGVSDNENNSSSFAEADSSQGSPQNAASSRRASVSTLESVLRGRNQQSSTKSNGKGIGKVVPPAVKSFIENGLLQDNVQWVAASIETLRTSSHGLSGSMHSAMKKAVDEDGASLLLLAVSLGCPGKVLHRLIRAGASVGEKEIFQAALTNQPESLLVLLQHSVYSKGSLNIAKCSAEVAEVLDKATVRQKAQEENMRKDGGNFVSMVVGKLFNLAFLCRLYKSRATNTCSKVVSDILVGNVLLHAMHESQRKASSSSTNTSSSGNGTDPTAADSENGRVPLFDSDNANASDTATEQNPGSSREGLLEVIPADVLRGSLESHGKDTVESQLTDALLLAESYLWSKAISDVSVGLTLVNSILRKIPGVRRSSLLQRFGIRELALSHETLASDARADAMDNFERSRAQLLANGTNASEPPQTASSVPTVPGCAVMCPMQHVAELHLTKHSSFRCDLCGKGVERGRPMHGCRQCDWDACEKCTDKAEGGIIKWGCILEMASECHALLSETEVSEIKVFNQDSSTDHCKTTADLKKLANLLSQRNCNALTELASLLLSPGRMTMHEFSTIILPSLHSALIEKPVGRSGSHLGIEMNSNRRSKKPRVGCSSQGDENTMGRDDFCRKVVQFFIETSEEDKNVSTSVSDMEDQSEADATNENIPLMQMEDQNDDGGDDEESDDASAEPRKDENNDESNPKIRTPEILRRLHEVLAFHESVNVVYNTRKGAGSNSAGSTGGDLQSLTQPLEIELLPSAIGSRNYCAVSTGTSNRGSRGMIVHVEPLMLVEGLHLHLLRACRLSHPTYARYCRRLALEQAIIAERPSTSECTGVHDRRSRRLAQIIGFDENTGAHTLRYATRLTKFAVMHGGMLDLRSNSVPVTDQIDFGDEEVTLVLAVRDYQVLHRNYQGRDTEGMAPFDMETELLLSDADVLLGSDIPTECNYGPSAGRPLIGNDTVAHPRATSLSTGMRVESNCASQDGSWGAYTIASVSSGEETTGESVQSNVDNIGYNLVSDSGEVFKGVSSSRIRGHDTLLPQNPRQRRRDRGRHDAFASDVRGELAQGRTYPMDRAFPFFHVRRPGSDISGGDPRSDNPSNQKVGVLKRSWSALSPIEDMNPIELSPNLSETQRPTKRLNQGMLLTCSIPGREKDILVEPSFTENPPLLRAELSAHENLPTIDTGLFEETTIYSALNQLFKRDESTQNKRLPSGDRIKVYYNVAVHDGSRKSKVMRRAFEKDVTPCPSFAPNLGKSLLLPDSISADHELNVSVNKPLITPCWNIGDDRARKHHAANDNDVVEDEDAVLCDGLNETSVCCMEIMCVLAEFSEIYGPSEIRKATKKAGAKIVNRAKGKNDASCVTSPIESESLTKKLVEQLEDPLTVVGGSLPEWCTVAPTYAPQIFSYASRRLLLERAAFGVSRSALKQQEAKVAVGPLRQRMASLRGRAVELVGEAFSGGAEDPTALQLQADELYGMEEALAARVTAAFRAQRWDERSLQCAKAAVRRDMLLSDAAAIMDRYANDSQVCRRRLEVRFDGESGFDAASGDEAGVTRGFYADVAESLLSCDHVSNVFCKPIGVGDTACAFVSDVARLEESTSKVSNHSSKLPLWIPDMDSSRQVIIPTPRADPGSGLGVYPRPILPHHPQWNAVLDQFRFMGRLFAAAMRDGFVLPLPLSTSFLRLVQHGSGVASLPPAPSTNIASYTSTKTHSNSMSTPVLNRNPSVEDMSVSEHSTSGNLVGTTCGAAALQGKLSKLALNSSDLPRPGFLGGEIYAVESFVCSALDKVDETEPPLSREETESRYLEIASDKSFARKAMGKSFDCCFEEYFENKTFVDPLDPAQGEEAMSLCPNGHTRSVTIHNVREWVALAKEFVLYEGVIYQAVSFRSGVEDFFSADYLRLFTADELQHDVCGGGDNVDKWDEAAVRSIFKLDGGKGAAEALVAVAAMGGEGGAALSRRFGPASPTIGHLVKTLLEASPTQRRQFLSFVTSVPIVTPGQIEVVPVVNPSGEFLPMRDPGCLPRANTCARRLYLPKFESYETFSQVLWAVVREESKFKGFYEWRG